MSLAIDIDEVTDVLLADGWHEVDGVSFLVDAYEYMEGPLPDGELLHGGGQGGVCSAGFLFREGTAFIQGPLTAILAVRTQPSRGRSSSQPPPALVSTP